MTFSLCFSSYLRIQMKENHKSWKNEEGYKSSSLITMATVKKSRRKTRQCLFQALYSCVYLQDTFEINWFMESFYDEEFAWSVDEEYFKEVFSWIQDKENELIYLVNRFAPKFDIHSMPVINLIPVFIASYEMLFLKCDVVPYKVSIDEALELTKTYSDDNWRILVNGILNSLKDSKEQVIKEMKEIKDDKRYLFNKNIWKKW